MENNSSLQAELLGQLLQQSAVGDNIQAGGQQQSAEQALLAALSGEGRPAAVEPEEVSAGQRILAAIAGGLQGYSAGLNGRPPDEISPLQRLLDRRKQRADEQTARNDESFDKEQQAKQIAAEFSLNNAREDKAMSQRSLDRSAENSREDQKYQAKIAREDEQAKTKREQQLADTAAERDFLHAENSRSRGNAAADKRESFQDSERHEGYRLIDLFIEGNNDPKAGPLIEPIGASKKSDEEIIDSFNRKLKTLDIRPREAERIRDDFMESMAKVRSQQAPPTDTGGQAGIGIPSIRPFAPGGTQFDPGILSNIGSGGGTSQGLGPLLEMLKAAMAKSGQQGDGSSLANSGLPISGGGGG